MKLRSAVIILITLLSINSAAWSEEPERGRLPDGRAFRTDAQGNEIVDYIAELEINVDSLERRVHGLEDEVRNKQAQLDRLGQGKDLSPSAGLKERDLLIGRESNPVPVRGMSAAAETDCAAQMSSLRELYQGTKDDLAVEKQLHAKTAENFKSQVARLNSELKRQDEEITLLQSRFSEAEQSAKSAASQASMAAAEARAAAERESERTRELEAARRDAEQARSVVALKPPMIGNTQTLSQSGMEGRASLTQARSRAVESLKGDLKTDLNRLKTNIATRDNLFRNFDQRGRTVQFKPQRLVSSRNQTVGSIAVAVDQANNVRELSVLSRDISELQRKVQDDINFIKRMKK